MENTSATAAGPPGDKVPPREDQANGPADEAGDTPDLTALMPEDPVGTRVQELLAGQKEQGKALEQIAGHMAAINQNMEKLSLGMVAVANDHSLLATAHEQMNRLGELHWEDRVIGPMVNRLFPIVDLVIGYRAASREKAENSPLKAVLSMLQDFFGTYGIEPYWPRGETKFDASLMKVVKVVPTSEEKLHNQVQVCLQAGFRRGRRVLRPSSVALWRYEAKPDQPQEHCNEGRS